MYIFLALRVHFSLCVYNSRCFRLEMLSFFTSLSITPCVNAYTISIIRVETWVLLSNDPVPVESRVVSYEFVGPRKRHTVVYRITHNFVALILSQGVKSNRPNALQ